MESNISESLNKMKVTQPQAWDTDDFIIFLEQSQLKSVAENFSIIIFCSFFYNVNLIFLILKNKESTTFNGNLFLLLNPKNSISLQMTRSSLKN